MQFDSIVTPQIELGDEFTPTESIQSALGKYNRHTHAFANTSNPLEMGLRIGLDIKYADDETSIPTGTTIQSINENTLTLSINSPIDIEKGRFIVEGKFVLDNCSIDENSNVLTLESQYGFINPDSLKLISYENFNSFLDVSGFDILEAPIVYPLYINTDISKYLTKLKILSDDIDVDYKLYLGDENNFIDDITRDSYLEFNLQTISNNTFLAKDSLISIELNSVPDSVKFLFFHFKFSKVFM